MRRWSFLLVMVLAFLIPLTVEAQSGLEFEKVNVAIWPEYDRPDVLVIYHLSLSSKITLPAEVSIRIPQVAGKPSAVAMQDADGTLVNLNYSSTPDGDWEKIIFSTPMPDIQIEYYDPRLTKNGAKRSYEYRWSGDYAVKSLSIQVQQPLGAGALQIVPNLGSGQTGQDGLVYYSSEVGELKAGTGFSINMSYEKKDNSLSINSQPVAASNPINPSTPGRLMWQEILPWLVGGIGLLLIAGGGVWFWLSGREQAAGDQRRRHGTVRARQEEEGEQSTASSIYCHQCGRRANSGDIFCRTCGTRLHL